MVDKIARGANMSKAKALKTLQVLTKIIVNTLKDGESIQLEGLGNLTVRQRNTRSGPRKTVVFYSSDNLKKELE